MPDELTSIFISYARADSPFVDQLEADPHRQGFAPWLDCRGLAGGQQWRRELQEAVDRCQVLLVVLSPDAVASPYVQIEYGWPGLCVITEGRQKHPPNDTTDSMSRYVASLLVSLSPCF
jgi:hypothetical protein